MGLDWKEWSRSDIIFGVVAPVLVVLLIVAISQAGRLFSGGFEGPEGILIGITMELQELVLIVAIPLLLGLVWNRWAGGASGFLLGSIYALYWADTYHSPFAGNIRGYGTVLLAYVVSGMFIGYVAGGLNKRSENFRRMLISGIVASTIGAVMLFSIFQLSSANVVTGVYGFLLTVLPRIACGAIVPVIAKLFTWYGLSANKKPNL